MLVCPPCLLPTDELAPYCALSTDVCARCGRLCDASRFSDRALRVQAREPDPSGTNTETNSP